MNKGLSDVVSKEISVWIALKDKPTVYKTFPNLGENPQAQVFAFGADEALFEGKRFKKKVDHAFFNSPMGRPERLVVYKKAYFE